MRCIKATTSLVLIMIIVVTIIFLSDERSIYMIPSIPAQPFRMSEIGNATLKAALGKSTWHLLHTMTVKYPLNPTKLEQTQFLGFMELLGQMYPCGECAAHFRRLLIRHPPRVGSRDEVVIWLCDIHNLTNERLGKSVVDCSTVKDMWKCGCADDIT